MFDAYPEFLVEAGSVLASPFWLLLILSVVAWRYGAGAWAEEGDADGDFSE